MTATDQLLENAKTYASSFDKTALPLPPAKKVAVVAWEAVGPGRSPAEAAGSG